LLRLQGYFNVYAGVTLPNKKSVGFHRSFGFRGVGVYKGIGYKFGEWHDVQWFQFELQQHIYNPASPRSIQSIINSKEFNNVFFIANEFLKKISTEKI
jgi:phosphinothricin acetyltransferase